MHFKLAYKNVLRNKKIYSVYFLTLSIIYSLIYSFNAVLMHPMFNELDGAQETINRIMNQYMDLASAFVVVLLAFLVVYVSDFVMKRRRRELGLYSSLGMRNSKVSLILSLETSFVNFFSLVAGLVLGLALSGGLAYLAQKLFHISYEGSLFYITPDSFKYVINVFIGILLVSWLVSWFRLRKIRIIKFLSERDDKSSFMVGNSSLDLVLFILSLVLMVGVGYTVKTTTNLTGLIKEYGQWILLALLVSVLMFYYSVSSSLVRLAKANKGYYYKGYNTLKIRQTSRNLGKNITAMAMLSLSLAASITLAISAESSLKATDKAIEEAGPFDFMVMHDFESSPETDKDSVNILDKLVDEAGIDRQDISYGAQTTSYVSDLTYGDILDCSNLYRFDMQRLPAKKINIISLSDYNKVMALQGKGELVLGGEEFAINCNYDGTINQWKDYLAQNPKINLAGFDLHAKDNPLLEETYQIIPPGGNDRGTIILADEVARTLTPVSETYIGKYQDESVEQEVWEKLMDFQTVNSYHDEEKGIMWSYLTYTKVELRDATYGFNGIIVFVLLYLDIVITVISLSVLSLQAMTEITDQVNDFKVLKSLGANNKRINKLISSQILSYFIAPFILAIPFSYVATNLFIGILEDQMGLVMPIKWSFVLGIVGLLVLYLVISYQTSKRGVHAELDK